MDDEIVFNNLQELYERLIPALTSKKDELIRLGFDYITINHIWNYLKDKKWLKSHNLLLYQMVDDIINSDPIEIDTYYQKIKS